MRFDEDSQAFVIDDDHAFPVRFFINETHHIPPYGRWENGLDIMTRVVRGTFENRWSVSIIWGSMTYCVNKDHPYGNWRGEASSEFIEEPDTVEVGIIMPEPLYKPAEKITLPGWKGPDEFPERHIELWGEPLAHVDALGLKWLLNAVSNFDSHSWRIPEAGPELVRDDEGHYSLDVEFKDNDKEEADGTATDTDVHG